MSREKLPDTIRRLLGREPVWRSADSVGVRAAVLVPLFADARDDSVRVWLLRRPETMRTHQGQVALPGGKWEPTDPDLLHTALREAHEEIGLRSEQVEVLGALDDCVTRTGYLMAPFVGWIREPFDPMPLPCEVARAFSVPLAVFAREPDLVPMEQLAGRSAACYRQDGETIWGATAAILRAFVRRIGPSGFDRTE